MLFSNLIAQNYFFIFHLIDDALEDIVDCFLFFILNLLNSVDLVRVVKFCKKSKLFFKLSEVLQPFAHPSLVESFEMKTIIMLL